MKPVQARWVVKCFDSVSKDVVAVRRGLIKAGLSEKMAIPLSKMSN